MFIRSLVKGFFLKLNLNITQLTSYPDIKNFFLKIKPKKFPSINIIRLGEDGDGGYFVPDSIKDFDYCFTFGVGNLCGFENELANRFNIKCYLFDYSVKSSPIKNKNFYFTKKFIIGAVNTVNDSKKSNYLTFDNFLKKCPDFKNKKKILKIDIEGGEYNILSHIKSSDLDSFEIIIIEFHHLSSILTPLCFRLVNDLFGKIHKNFYVLSNVATEGFSYFSYKDIKIYDLLEITFVNKKYIK
jgi:hypothetical protein